MLGNYDVDDNDDDVDDHIPEGDNKAVVDVDKGKTEQVVQPKHQPGDGGLDIGVDGDDDGDVDIDIDFDDDGDVERKAEQVMKPEHQPGGQDHHDHGEEHYPVDRVVMIMVKEKGLVVMMIRT